MMPTLSLERWARLEGRVCWAEVSGVIHRGLRSITGRKPSPLSGSAGPWCRWG
ncbi:hypothetical protein [Meiothermus sp.]|jgi:hypothetical protein|uniref:hypothetical protein n=1 Tax=Meiothermus sp. TaxID=1955249 RepID=UPI00307F4440